MTPNEQHDHAEIRHLMATYTINGDRGRVAALAATFAKDGILQFSGTSSTGPAAIAARLAQRPPHNPALTLSRHHITMSLIELDGHQATARTYFQVLTDIGLDHHGMYVDELTQINGTWRFTLREVRIDWQSPNSLYPALHVRGVAPGAAGQSSEA